MERYYLQEGDGVHVADTRNLMLVITGTHLALSDFDADAVDLVFHWHDAAYPVRRDGCRYYIEVDEDTCRELTGGDVAAGGDAGQPARALDLLDCLDGDEGLAARVHEAVIRARPDAWRGFAARERVVKQAIYGVVGDIATTERVFHVIEANTEY